MLSACSWPQWQALPHSVSCAVFMFGGSFPLRLKTTAHSAVSHDYSNRRAKLSAGPPLCSAAICILSPSGPGERVLRACRRETSRESRWQQIGDSSADCTRSEILSSIERACEELVGDPSPRLGTQAGAAGLAVRFVGGCESRAQDRASAQLTCATVAHAARIYVGSFDHEKAPGFVRLSTCSLAAAGAPGFSKESRVRPSLGAR